MELLSTTDYPIFKTITGNRAINKEHIEKIATSIQEKNLLPVRPIVVNDKMEVIDGQHRLAAAELIKVPIYYVVANGLDYEDIASLNSASKNWTTADYVRMYDLQGYPEYKKISDLAKTTGLSLECVLYIVLRNNFCRNIFKEKNIIKDNISNFRAGEFEFKELDLLTAFFIDLVRLLDFCNSITSKQSRYNFVTAGRFMDAFLRLWKSGIDMKVLFEHIEMKPTMFNRRSSSKEYYEMLLEVYNWKMRCGRIGDATSEQNKRA
jgi:hypothetical protein